LLLCYLLTVVFDMVIAVSVGVVLAALLFMRRTAELTHSRLLEANESESEHALAPGVALYEIAGPLFFGAAQNAMGAIGSVGADVRVVVLALGGVPSIDATGFVALESSIKRLRSLGKQVILAGPLPHPRSVFERANLAQHHEHVHFAHSLAEGLVKARALAETAAPTHFQRPASHTA
jgi:SulP family sulfate permease